MARPDIVICSPVRTAIGTYNGTLKDTPAVELGRNRHQGLPRSRQVVGKDVGTVVMGNVIQAGNKMNPARQAAIAGGIPVEVPAMTVNRVCGSGAQAIATAAARSSSASLTLPSLAAWRTWMPLRISCTAAAGATGWAMPRSTTPCSRTASMMRSQASIPAGTPRILPPSTRSRVQAQDRMGAAVAAAVFCGPGGGQVRCRDRSGDGKSRKGPQPFAKDEHNRPDTTAESLAKLKPAFRKDGTITAGNAPGLNAGAAAMFIAEHQWADKKSLKALGRLVSWGVGAVEPGMFGLGPVPAVKQALERAGWKIADVERFEINEAFAAIALAVMRDLGLPEDIVNVEGNSIAHGHPIGATGALQTTRLLHSMQRDGSKRGVVTMCIGGGQGIALCLEAAK